jgi:uncharacterized membrane protein YuzA (DUF378 family)
MGSPIAKWEGAAQYFTYADKPTVLYIILGIAAALTLLSIIKVGNHEKECYEKLK